jgi:hypothetical protein
VTRPVLVLALVALALPVTGCRSNEERSAELEHKALAAGHGNSSNEGVSIKVPSRFVHVVATAALTGKEADAVAITLRNEGPKALAGMPIEFAVLGAGGKQLYTNAAGGLAPSLERVPTIPAHGELTWVDDQVTLTSRVARVTARVGEGRPSSAPPIAVSGVHTVTEAGAEALEASITSPGPATYSELVVYASARRGGRVVAAGRAIVSSVPPHNAVAVPQIFLAGGAKGATLQVTAPVP